MALIAVACITAGATINVAMDGGGPPRVGTRAEASPYSAPVVTAAPSSPAPTMSSSRLPKASPARIEDLERELSTAQPSELLPDLVAQDPEGAARSAEMHTEPVVRQRALREVALLWGAVNAERALNWARSLPDAAELDATFIDIAEMDFRALIRPAVSSFVSNSLPLPNPTALSAISCSSGRATTTTTRSPGRIRARPARNATI